MLNKLMDTDHFIALTKVIVIVLSINSLLNPSVSFANPEGESEQTTRSYLTFDHAGKDHKSLPCTACHPSSSEANNTRPGASHLSCSGSSCHDFYGVSKETNQTKSVCQVCHLNDQPWSVNAQNIKPFPTEDKSERELCTPFPHKTHLALSDTPTQNQCVGCHRTNSESTERQGPTHAQCVDCHKDQQVAQDQSKTKAHSFSECTECHQPRKRWKNKLCTSWNRSRGLRVAYRFKHSTHELDVRTNPPEPLSCAQCHPYIARDRGADTSGKWRAVKILSSRAMARSCGPCHNGRVKNPKTGRRVFSVSDSSACGKCHNFNLSPAQKKRGHGKKAW